MEYPTLYLQFLYHFNVKRDYYQCHDFMEELWLEEGRDRLYQGLLQVAVGLYHFRNHNISGAIKLMTGAVEKLEGYPEVALGINIKKLREETIEYLRKLQHYDEEPFPFYDLNIEILDDVLYRSIQEMMQMEKNNPA